jgi:hypothetical protein
MQIKNEKGDFFKTAKVFNILKLYLEFCYFKVDEQKKRGLNENKFINNYSTTYWHILLFLVCLAGENFFIYV